MAKELDGIDDLDANLFGFKKSDRNLSTSKGHSVNPPKDIDFDTANETTTNFSRSSFSSRKRVDSQFSLGSSAENLDSAIEMGSKPKSKEKEKENPKSFSDESLDDLLDSMDSPKTVVAKKDKPGAKSILSEEEQRNIDHIELGSSPAKQFKGKEEAEIVTKEASRESSVRGAEESLNTSNIGPDFEDDGDDILGALGLNDSAMKDSNERKSVKQSSSKPLSSVANEVKSVHDKGSTEIPTGYEPSGLADNSNDKMQAKKTFSLTQRRRSGKRPILGANLIAGENTPSAANSFSDITGNSMESLDSMPSEHNAQLSRNSSRPVSRYGSFNNFSSVRDNSQERSPAMRNNSRTLSPSLEKNLASLDFEVSSTGRTPVVVENSKSNNAAENFSEHKFPWENAEKDRPSTAPGKPQNETKPVITPIKAEAVEKIELVVDDTPTNEAATSMASGRSLEAENECKQNPFSPIFPADKRNTRQDLLKEMEELKRQITEFEQKILILNDTICKHEANEKVLMSENAAFAIKLEASHAKSENELDARDAEEGLRRQISSLEDEVKRYKESFENTLTKQENLNSKIFELKTKICSLENANALLQKSQTQKLKEIEEEHLGNVLKLKNEYETKLSTVEARARSALEESKGFQDSRFSEFTKLKDETIASIRKDHQFALNTQRDLYEQQIADLKKSVNTSDSMQSLIASVRTSTQEVGMLQQLVENEHKASLSERESAIRDRESQLETYRLEMLRKQSVLDKERDNLQSLLLKVNNAKECDAVEFDAEKKRLEERKRELKVQEQALEEQRQSQLESFAQERKGIQNERAALTKEREELILKASELTKSERSVLEKGQRDTSKILIAQTDIDNAAHELEKKQVELQGKSAKLENEAKIMSSERRQLVCEMEEFAKEKQVLTSIALEIQEQSSTLKALHRQYADEKQCVANEMLKVKDVQSQINRKEKEINTRTGLLQDLEKRIAHERLELAKARRDSSLSASSKFVLIPERHAAGCYESVPHRDDYSNSQYSFRTYNQTFSPFAYNQGSLDFSRPNSYDCGPKLSYSTPSQLRPGPVSVAANHAGALNQSQLSPLYQKLKEVSELIHKVRTYRFPFHLSPIQL